MKGYFSFLTFIFLFISHLALGQSFPVTINVTVNPPYTPNALRYQDDPNKVYLTITNTSQNPLNIYLQSSVSSQSGIGAQTSATEPWAGPPFTLMPGTIPLSFSMLRPYIENTPYTYQGITNNDIRTGNIPEGIYQICFRAFDYNTRQPLSAENPGGCSAPFMILNPQPPQIIAPVCGDSIQFAIPQQILFNWQMPYGVSMNIPLQYDFRLVELPAGTNPQLILQSNTGLFPIIERSGLMTTHYMLTMADPPLVSGKTYAWAVRAVDPSGNYVFQNNGYSQVCTFKYYTPQEDSPNSGAFTAVYPVNNDTIPWSDFPIIHRFDPFSATYKHYTSNFKIFENNTEVGSYDANYSWSDGPLQGQIQALGMTITQEQSQHLALFKSQSFRTPALNFEKGKTYRWQTNAKMYNTTNPGSSSSPVLQGNPSSRFTAGMGRPLPIEPKNKDTLGEGNIQFKFKTANKPTKILPPFMIAQSGNVGTPSASFYNGIINEKWVLEISKKQDFSVNYKTETGTIDGLELNGTCNEACLEAALYKDINLNINVEDTGTYYWRVKWLKYPSQSNSEAYITSEVRKFYIGDKDSIPADTTRTEPTPPSCIASCLAPEVIASQKVPVSTATVGSTLRIGLFDMRITEISWTANTGSGKGTITTPLFRAPMKVSFTNISANAAGVIYNGTVTGDYDNSSVIPSGTLSGAGINNPQLQQTIESCMNFVEGGGRLVSALATGMPMGLPIGIDREIEGQRFVIGIVGLTFTPEKATLNAVMSYDVHELNSTLGLGASDICFSPGSISGGQGRLYLPGDINIPMNNERDAVFRINGTEFNSTYSAISDSGTFVSWDCQGFKKLVVDGSVIFNNRILVEDLSSGLQGTDTIRADFRVVLAKGWNFMSRLNFNKAFQVKDVQGLGFEISEAWVDFSISDNPTDFSFPPEYIARFSAPTPATAWKGVYIKTLGVRLPPEFKIGNSTNRITGAGRNLLFDRRGFTGYLGIENLISINSGNLDGWAYSLDSLYVSFAGNSLVRGGLKGNVRVPLDTATNLSYRAIIASNPGAPLTFNFRVKPERELRARVWKATLSLDSTTYISLYSGPQPGNASNRGFVAEAMINGRLSVSGDLGNIGNILIPELRVNRLLVKSRSPYCVMDTNTFVFSHASPQKFFGPMQGDGLDGNHSTNTGNGFPISIRNVRPVMGTGPDGSPEVGLAFGTYLNLMSERSGFAASMNMSILGKINTSTPQSYSFSRVRVDSISIDGAVGIVTLRGRLGFYEQDNVYGNGVKGELAAEFKPMIKARVTGQFGTVNDMRYWYADASVYFTPPLKVIPEQFEVFGFGGGAWYKMRRNGVLTIPTSTTRPDTTSNRAQAGTSRSGATYVPDPNVSFGFEAMAAFGSGQNGKTYNADARIGADFSSEGGLNSIWLNGDAYIMANRNERANAPIVAGVRIMYSHPTNTFSANFKAKVNAAGGKIKGRLAGDTAGTIALLITPDDWHLHFGTPSTAMGIRIMDFADLNAYIMAGKNLPPALPPPDRVLAILQMPVQDERAGDQTSYMNGDGFAFGARFDVNIPRQNFLIFYGKLNFGAGLDVSLKRYEGVYCEGAAPGTPIGMNGWYTRGDMYAYIDADLGLFVDVWFVKGEYSILKMALASYLQCGFPAPSYFKGTVGGNYNVLNGLVTGNCRFDFKFGDECRMPPANPLTGIKVIASIKPGDGETDVDCGIIPITTFNVEVERPFEISLPSIGSEPRVVKTYKFVIENYQLLDDQGQVITTQSNSLDGFSSELIPSQFLKANTNHRIRLTLGGREKQADGTFTQSYTPQGAAIRLDTTVVFRTGNYPTSIPESNIAYTYPLRRQRTFLQNECRNGIVKLKIAMPPLFDAHPPGLPAGVLYLRFIARFIPVEGGESKQSDVTVNGTDIRFNIPPLDNSKVYAVQILSKQVKNVDNYDPDLGPGASIFSQFTANNPAFAGSLPSISAAASFSYSSTANGQAQVRSTRRDARNVAWGEHLIYLFFFKTSRFNNLEEKVQSLNMTAVNYSAETFSPDFSGPEKFDDYDVNGTAYQIGNNTNFTLPPLVRLTNPMSDAWSNSFAIPVMYNLYQRLVNAGYTNVYLIRDYADFIGVPPVKTAEWHNEYNYATKLGQGECLPPAGSPSPLLAQYFSGPAFAAGQGAFQQYLGGLHYNSATAKISVSTPLQVYLDYQRMRTIVSQVIYRYGTWDPGEFYDPETRRLLRLFRTTDYATATHASDYKVTFSYMKLLGLSERPRFTPYLNCNNLPLIGSGYKFITY